MPLSGKLLPDLEPTDHAARRVIKHVAMNEPGPGIVCHEGDVDLFIAFHEHGVSPRRGSVLGKVRTYVHLALKVRLSENDPFTMWGKKLQVIVNDVARIVVRKRRSDHVRVEDLLKKAGLQTINLIVCYNSAMLALRASNPDSPLHELFEDMLPNNDVSVYISNSILMSMFISQRSAHLGLACTR